MSEEKQPLEIWPSLAHHNHPTVGPLFLAHFSAQIKTNIKSARAISWRGDTFIIERIDTGSFEILENPVCSGISPLRNVVYVSTACKSDIPNRHLKAAQY